MLIRLLFWLFLLSAFALVFRYGRTTERAFAGFLLVCTGLTLGFDRVLGLNAAFSYVLLIDAVILLVALRIAAESSAHWPIWFCGFHLIAVASGIAYLLFPTGFVGLHGNAAGFWALPALMALVLGTLADHRMRMATARACDARG